MSQLFDDLAPPVGLHPAWHGRFASSPADFTTRAYVILPDLDPTLRLGPCRWQSRDPVSLPVKGDDCLVIFDNDREPWIVMWWPFA